VDVIILNRIEIKEFAKNKRKNNLWIIWSAILIVTFLSGGLSLYLENDNIIGNPPLYLILSLILAAVISPLQVGVANYINKINNDQRPKINILFNYFKYFKNIFLANLFCQLIIFIGFTLFVIPGIIASLSLVLVNFYYVNNPNAKFIEALEYSYNKMKGRKWDLFLFYLSFIGIFCLIVITAGIYSIWGIPYMTLAIYKYIFNIVEEEKELTNS
jgi:uncharacterized membrane protein